MPEIEPFEVGRDWPQRALKALRRGESARRAADVPASEVRLALRNALAHGGVTYLDREGGQAEFATHMFRFASFVRPRASELRLLRISVAAFESFLRLWTDWLSSSGVLDQLDKHGPGYLEYAAE